MNEEELRNLFISQLKQKSLGPGYASDLISCSHDFSDEVLNEDPTYCYLTGVIVPPGTNDDLETIVPEDTDHSDEGEMNPQEAQNEVLDDDGNEEHQSDDKPSSSMAEKNDVDYIQSDKFGLISCVPTEVERVRMEVSYAKYVKIPNEDIPQQVHVKVGSHFNAINEIFELNNTDELNEYLNTLNLPQPFSALFSFSDTREFISLSESVAIPRNFDLKRLNRQDLNAEQVDANNKLKILLRSNFYKRISFVQERNLDVQYDADFDLDENIHCFVTTFQFRRRRYVKVLLQNHIADRGSYSNCLFQPELKLKTYDGVRFESYVDPILVENDLESQINEYMYKDLKNYGKGIGCALSWNNDATEVRTTFMPQCDVKKYTNGPSTDVCTLRNISIWSEWDRHRIMTELRTFVQGYRNWHQDEIMNANLDIPAANEIISQQNRLLDRMSENLNYLEENDEAFECFKIANTAMLIQMVISRHPDFKKNRSLHEYDEHHDLYSNINYFRDAHYIREEFSEPSYRSFQLAFLLINVRSTFVEDDPDRVDNVDLIWFPTGGGKTEAYLALSALTIVHRRRSGAEVGVSVIMRYTLRLLTTQQFERASFLICALEFLRNQDASLRLGDNEPISIGLWIGKNSSPNSLRELTARTGKYSRYLDNPHSSASPFPVNYCPWCGCKLRNAENNIHGYLRGGELECLNRDCLFCDLRLPIYYIDDNVYRHKPTLLFATVDKFASLTKRSAAEMLGFNNTNLSPDLIIQDELHLISGPLGSIVGLFEMIVEEMCSKNGHRPKVIASTATTRNTKNLISNLYGGKNVSIFPAYGLSYSDNYFSHIDEDANRSHLGIMPTTHTNSNAAEIKLTANLLLARAKVMEAVLRERSIDLTDLDAVFNEIQNDFLLKSEFDNYWSIVLYYNSLKDLGRSYSRASQEVYENYRSKKIYYQIPHSLDFICNNFNGRIQEFTSREDSSRIKDLLTAAESKVPLRQGDKHKICIDGYRHQVIDLVYASNMISVGIDISRWNLMLMVGQPRSSSEYIQSSSRVARSHKGLVVNLLNSLRNREYSLFENYVPFHQAYYKFVEPLSITPITVQTLNCDIFKNVVECYRQYILDPADRDDIDVLSQNLLDRMVAYFKLADQSLIDHLQRKINDICQELIDTHGHVDFASSLHYVDVCCYSKISELQY